MRPWIGTFLAASLALSVGVAFGQGAVALSVEQVSPPPAFPVMSGISSGSGIFTYAGGFDGSGMKGQPYSLVEKTTTLRVLGDGTTINNVREERRMRDSEGRQRIETARVIDGTPHADIRIYDPVTRTTTTLVEQIKEARVSHIPELKPETPEQEARIAEIRQKAAATRATQVAQNQATGVTPEPKRQISRREKLEPRNIAGLYAEGWRMVMVIPVGQQGNDREIRVVMENWRSPDLGIELARTTDDPRMGKSTMEVTEVQRVDPDPALFQIPAGYKVIEPKRMGETTE